MFEKEFYSEKNRAYRHVSPNSAYRAHQHLGQTLVVLFICLFSFQSLAETGASNVVSTKNETEIRREPYPDAESLGVLPAKSLVTLTGDERSGFTEVSVELEEGELTGWIENSAVKEEEIGFEDSAEKKVIRVRKRKKKGPRKIDVPVDEGVLLGRQSTFSYGALGGFHLNQINIEEPEGTASGNGFSAGVSLSFVLDPSFKFRPELTYSSHSGIDASDRLVSFGFFDIAALGEFPISKEFFLVAGLQYSLCMGFDNSENAVSPNLIEEAAEASGLWGQLGAGYKFSVGEQSYLSLRANYRGAFMTSPVGFHAFGIQAVFEIEG